MAHANNFLAKGYGSTRQWLAPFQLVDDTGTVQFGVAADGTLTIPGATAINASGDLAVVGNLSVGGTSAFTGDATFSGNLVMSDEKIIDASALTGDDAVIKFTLTTDTPTVAFGTNSGHDASTSPAGFLKVIVGSTPYYIPVWA